MIRPFLTNKGSQNTETIAILDNGNIISDTNEIFEKFNTFLVNVAKDIGDVADCLSPEDHPSIYVIWANRTSVESEFKFKPVDEAKATGLDTRCTTFLRKCVLSKIL